MSINKLSINGNILDINNRNECLNINKNGDFICFKSDTLNFHQLGQTNSAIFPDEMMRIMFTSKDNIDMLGIQYCTDYSGIYGQILLNCYDNWYGLSVKYHPQNGIVHLYGITPRTDCNSNEIPTCQWVRNLLTRNGITLTN